MNVGDEGDVAGADFGVRGLSGLRKQIKERITIDVMVSRCWATAAQSGR